ncbi:MAG TPA: glycosyl hydrolase family 28-related protein, partial [Longimicrobiales bacterium]|nr:glycosyl hydrolase family 28-related protein [Longimicrobiales bacterium]
MRVSAIPLVVVLAIALARPAVGSEGPGVPTPGASAPDANPAAATFDIRDYGAVGDGVTLDTDAINAAIDAAAAAGGGTVLFPAGTYASYTIRLKSHVHLHFEAGATLLAAVPTAERGYDPPEPGPGNEYQDFGHSHWQNSFMWGIGVENISITGFGLIDGAGLWRGLGPQPPNAGNKTIALKLARNITIRDISILNGGHFAILATGVDNLTIDNVRIDTNRDGINIDSCRNVRIMNVSVNSPNDDAIVLKSSFGLGYAQPTENVTITNSLVAGYDIGSLLDGTYQRTVTAAPDRDGPTGRIKFGTESNGGFKNITISNIVFDRARGIALETVDGGLLEDVTITNITMREVSNAPFFLRLGARMRGPEGMEPGELRRIRISNVNVYDADPRYASIISGIPGYPVEDVTISGVRIYYRGGLSLDDAAQQPDTLVNTFFFNGPETGPREDPYAVPVRANAYPEPSMFGIIPAYGFYIRHAEGIRIQDVEIHFMEEDERPAFVLDQVRDVEFTNV